MAHTGEWRMLWYVLELLKADHARSCADAINNNPECGNDGMGCTEGLKELWDRMITSG